MPLGSTRRSPARVLASRLSFSADSLPGLAYVAEGLQLNSSGVTRLLNGLHHGGLVEKGKSRRDARVTCGPSVNAM